ncbi:hypothetical protein [Hoeflea sp.]|uniref:hypothetical protein n=1 Tax=Hoeflea sp. TaxID=1940281 RepID=UPI003A92DACA
MGATVSIALTGGTDMVAQRCASVVLVSHPRKIQVADAGLTPKSFARPEAVHEQ